MNGAPDPQPFPKGIPSKRAAPQWLVEYLRTDQTFWNWMHENAASFARSWFEWLNWVVILAALEVVATKYKLRLAEIVLWVSYMLIFLYFHSIYWSSARVFADPLTGVPRRSVLTWVFAAVPAIFLALLAQALAGAVSHVAP